MYAIVDIETTGGSPHTGGITEVCIVLHNGHEVEGHYETLLNPLQWIPPHITALTGIDNQMVSSAPQIAEVASEIFNLLSDRVFVAHHVNFDFTFLHHALLQYGYSLQVKKLCTVRYARKVVPGLQRYGLDALCRYFEIDNSARHRAAGDALATATLFGKLMALDSGSTQLRAMLHGRNKEMYLPAHLSADAFDRLPYLPGVYYFRDAKNQLLYVGKAKNIRKRVASHFSNNSGTGRKQELLRQIHAIEFKVCANDLHAAIWEELEIKKWWPPFNRSQKGPEMVYGLYFFDDQRGMRRGCISKVRSHMPPLIYCRHVGEGFRLGRQLAQQYGLHPDHFFATAQIPDYQPAALDLHNNAMHQLEQEARQMLPAFILVLRGKNEQADPFYALFQVEAGAFAGMAIVANCPASYKEARQEILPHSGNAFVYQMLTAEAMKSPDHLLMPADALSL